MIRMRRRALSSTFDDGPAATGASPLPLAPPPPPPPCDFALLTDQIHVLWVSGLTKKPTRALFIAFIMRWGPKKFPCPLAVSKIAASISLVGFRTRHEVATAQKLLDKVPLPKMKTKLSAVSGNSAPNGSFKWLDFSTEVRDARVQTGALPLARPVFAEMAPSPDKTCVSVDYQAELYRIKHGEGEGESAGESSRSGTERASSRRFATPAVTFTTFTSVTFVGTASLASRSAATASPSAQSTSGPGSGLFSNLSPGAGIAA
ncbi:hypothetical protein JCM3774_001975 [Rhodotorula dairenensis]